MTKGMNRVKIEESSWSLSEIVGHLGFVMEAPGNIHGEEIVGFV